MTIENPFASNEGAPIERENNIDNTASFQEAITAGNLSQAEAWLDQAQGQEKYDARWTDHRERELFRAYYQAQDWVGAKRIVEKTKNPESQAGRKVRLEELSGLKYDQI